jgi:transcriptional regulator with XRE-family HTH domain
MAQSTQNLVGPQVRKARYGLGWSQEQLAARLGRIGWDLSRGTVAKIESGVRCVNDWELLTLSRALKVGIEELFPAKSRR